MKNRFNRRQFLRSASGATLAIPFLPSLVKDARAQDLTMPKFFVTMAYENGGIWGSNMYPEESTLSNSVNYAGRAVRHGELLGTLSEGNRILCPALTAPETVLTPALLSKINVLRGLDIAWYLSHHKGGYLGNLAANDSNEAYQLQHRRTIDQIMAYSPNFYASTDGLIERSVALGNRKDMSWNYANPTQQSGPFQSAMTYQNDLILFKGLFTPGERYAGINTYIVDRVLTRFNSIRQSSGISNSDRMRLDQHMEQIYEIQRKMQTTLICDPDALPNGFSQPGSPNSNMSLFYPDYNYNPVLQGQYWQAFNDVLVVAFSCGLTNIATMLLGETFSTYNGGGAWHQAVTHYATLPEYQDWIVEANRNIFEYVFLDLATKLDAVQTADGQTLLDHALIMWTQECGQITHYTHGLPVVTAGGAGGFFNTGNFVDYRNADIVYNNGDTRYNDSPGLIWNQWMGTILQSMNVSPSEYEDGENGGYGFHRIDADIAADYAEAELVMGEPLPIIT